MVDTWGRVLVVERGQNDSDIHDEKSESMDGDIIRTR